jgi:hypothetical protein
MVMFSVHVFFPAGDTGFAKTGTHYIEPSGRMLLSKWQSQSYRYGADTCRDEESLFAGQTKRRSSRALPFLRRVRTWPKRLVRRNEAISSSLSIVLLCDYYNAE